MCVDYRRLNEITKKNSYLLLLIDSMRDTIREAIIFIVLDVREVYYRVRIKEGDE